MSLPGSKLGLFASGAAVGLAYGLLLRFGAEVIFRGRFLPVISIGFLFLLPFAMGFVSVFLVERRQPQPVWVWLVLPLVPVAGSLAATMAALWEGLICVVMFAPIGIGLAVVGGLAAGLVVRFLLSRPARNTALACVMVLPLVVGPWEQQVRPRQELRRVESTIDIAAPPAVVWRNIERVPRIHPEELAPSWSRRIGFPRPVEATLSFEGVGGVRHASFEGGILFVETIDVWEPLHRLAFSIRAQTDQIPRTTLDEHVTIGGPYFDVLRGEYALEPLPNGSTRLHLLSQHRVSTDFNWYARLWTDAVMADIQRTILHVIQKRCEARSSPASADPTP
jgi:hypothetical protein